MNPHERYELRPGEWREDSPRVSYGADRSGLVKLIGAEMSASPWTEGESATGPRTEVHGRTLACPPTDEDLDWLRRHATPAPYGRGEEAREPRPRTAASWRNSPSERAMRRSVAIWRTSSPHTG